MSSPEGPAAPWVWWAACLMASASRPLNVMGLTGSDSPSTREETSGSLPKARLFQAYADSSSLECIAMKAITVMQILLLQNVIHLQRQMGLWLDGDIQALLDEGKCIQKRLGRVTSPSMMQLPGFSETSCYRGKFKVHTFQETPMGCAQIRTGSKNWWIHTTIN